MTPGKIGSIRATTSPGFGNTILPHESASWVTGLGSGWRSDVGRADTPKPSAATNPDVSSLPETSSRSLIGQATRRGVSNRRGEALRPELLEGREPTEPSSPVWIMQQQ